MPLKPVSAAFPASRLLRLAAVCWLLSVAAFGSAEDASQQWGHWRGPTGNSVAPDANPPLRFDGNSPRWKTAIEGRGSGSPVVWDDQIFVTAAASTSGNDGRLDFRLYAIDRSSGKIRWQRTATSAVPHEGTHSTNTFASASPCTDGKLVYAFFGSRGLHAFTVDGTAVWSRDFGDLTMRNGFGEGASPTIAGDMVLVPWDHEGQSRLIAVDKTTGETVWEVKRDEPSNWGTPLVVAVGDSKQVVQTGQNEVCGYDLASGRLLWRCGGQTQRPVASPVAGGGLVFVGSGFRGSFLAAIDPSGRGDLRGTDSVVWSVERDTPDLASLLLSDDRLYFTKGKTGLLTCVDAATGKPHFQTQRVDGLRTLYASPVAAAGHLFFTDRSGTVTVIKDAAVYQPVSVNSVGEPTDATPAIIDNQIFIRGVDHLFCFES